MTYTCMLMCECVDASQYKHMHTNTKHKIQTNKAAQPIVPIDDV